MDHTVRSLAYLDVISDDKNILSEDIDSDNEALAMSVLLLKATYTILELTLYSSRTLDLAMKLKSSPKLNTSSSMICGIPCRTSFPTARRGDEKSTDYR